MPTKVFTMRLDAALVKRIETARKYVAPAEFQGGVFTGPLPRIGRTELIRWLLEVGLNTVEQARPRNKGGAR